MILPSLSWVERMMHLADEVALFSKDPKRKVGCIITNSEMNILATGYNGFPRGLQDTDERLYNQSYKLLAIVHAEANAVSSAARHGVTLRGGIAFVTRPLCCQCASLMVQAGIAAVFYRDADMSESKWALSTSEALKLLTECQVVNQAL